MSSSRNCHLSCHAEVTTNSYIPTTHTESNISDAVASSPNNIVKRIKATNVNRLIFGQLNINSLRDKIDVLKYLIMGNIDILIITESKLDETFLDSQFTMDGYSPPPPPPPPTPPPFRCDRNSNGDGVIIYVREDIPCKELKVHHIPQLLFLEGIFLEVNLKKSKWLLFGGL